MSEKRENIVALSTEKINQNTKNIDEKSTLEMVTLINKEDELVAKAIRNALPEIAKTIDCASEKLKNGGRLIYIGAGTSGRLGILDASECPPTFGVSSDLVVGLIAGGDKAIRFAVENAEDSIEFAKKDLMEMSLSSKDILIGISASGRTPYVIGGLKYAKEVGAATASIACNYNSKIGSVADIAIEVELGPEVIAGSTRLKSGTAQKMILNMISTGTMIKLGKVKGNLMTHVVPTNEKLRIRAEMIKSMAEE